MVVRASSNVIISEEEEKKVTIEYLSKKFDIKGDCHIENGELVKYVDLYSHKHDEERTVVRTATLMDNCVISILSELKSSIN